jgi:uncharacterized membrane protein
MNAPFWALSAIYWLHMLATVVWIGGLAAIALLVLPAARRSLEAAAYANFLAALQRRLDPLSWICLLVLAGTGMFQMSANPNYQGFLTISNRWAVAILIKHIVFFLMAGVSVYMTWGILPRLQRVALRQARGMDAPEAVVLQRQEAFLLRLNLALGVIVLGLTAIARVS